MPGVVKIGSGLALRLISSRAPYGRAGVRFEASPDRVYGVVEIGVDDLLDGAIEQLLADPYVDVSIGLPSGAFLPIADLTAFEGVAADMAEAVAELAADTGFRFSVGYPIDDPVAVSDADRIAIEQSRDGGPLGDETAPATEPPPAEAPATKAVAKPKK